MTVFSVGLMALDRDIPIIIHSPYLPIFWDIGPDWNMVIQYKYQGTNNNTDIIIIHSWQVMLIPSGKFPVTVKVISVARQTTCQNRKNSLFNVRCWAFDVRRSFFFYIDVEKYSKNPTYKRCLPIPSISAISFENSSGLLNKCSGFGKPSGFFSRTSLSPE